MARQSITPIPYKRSKRPDMRTAYSSGRAGKMIPIDYIPVLRGESGVGRAVVTCQLAEMPKPLRNRVVGNLQAWFVPKSADPRFLSHAEFMASYNQEPLKAHGRPDMEPLPFYQPMAAAHFTALSTSPLAYHLGLHLNNAVLGANEAYNVELWEAYNLIWNFRAAAHSSRIPLRDFYQPDAMPEDYPELARAFWMQNRFSGVVSDYEAALINGSIALDVQAGLLPLEGIMVSAHGPDGILAEPAIQAETIGDNRYVTVSGHSGDMVQGITLRTRPDGLAAEVFAQMQGQKVITSLADFDIARTVQAMAKARQAYAGNKTTPYSNEDAIVAELMRGLHVPQDMFKRPILLDSKMVTFDMVERHATDGASLDQSVTQGAFTSALSLNLPAQDVGGVIMIVMEIAPDRIYERQGDPWMMFNTTQPTAHLPDALRDIQRPTPVDEVQQYRLDARHSQPKGLYGYEPMNDRWRRDFVALGGDFYQEDPEAPWKESRSALWLPEIKDPVFSVDHYLMPEDFPHDVFADTLGSAFEYQVSHSMVFDTMVQFGDVLFENNGEYEDTQILTGEE